VLFTGIKPFLYHDEEKLM